MDADPEDATPWWKALTTETQAALKTNPRRHLEPAIAGEVQRAGAVLVTVEVEGEEDPRTMLPDLLIEFVETKTS